MPLFFLFVAILLIASGITGKTGDLWDLFKGDMTSKNGVAGFPVWMLALFLVGAIGYARELKPLSNAFLVLVFLGMILSNRGFLEKFSQAIKGA